MMRMFFPVVLVCFAALPAWADAEKADELATTREPFAVVELFTSEGCSSCPPAEELLNEISRDARGDGPNIYALAWHVDYWNRLGWTDRFSDAAYSQRQRDYGRHFNLRAIYTPQMVVNGSAEFVGSNRRQSDREVRSALEDTEPPTLGIGVAWLDPQALEPGETATLRWRLDALPEPATLHAVIAEDGLVTRVGRGENRGETLRHEGVVRRWVSQQITATEGRLAIELPKDLELSQASVVVFVQGTQDFRMLAARRLALASAETD